MPDNIPVNNLLAKLPTHLPDELVETLAENSHARIERIVSTGQTSPPGFWYDQAETEWVLVVKGEARILFEGQPRPLSLKPGDFLLIPPHQKHRVEWTSPEEPTLWLAVFLSEPTTEIRG